MVVAFTSIKCNSDSNSQKESSTTYLNHNDTVKYVGIQTCRSCHNEIYQTFIKTGMGSSFDVASKSKSAADFSVHQVVYDAFKNLYYHPFWKNDSMYIMEYRMDGKDTIHQRTERVSYIVGSGQHTNSHMMEVNGYVYQLPLTWYAQKRKWDLPPGFENGHNVRFNREIGFECMSCHNAMPTYVTNSTNKFTNIPMGIDCERCHGPGEAHVKEKLAGVKIDTAHQIDYSIVNPRKLTWKLQIDICQRCHLQGNAVLKNGKNFGDFRPGKSLTDYIDIYSPKYKGREDEFIMASHAQRLQLSKCFIASNKGDQTKLTCITCHNPHVSVKVTGKQVFNTACMNCHSGTQGCKEKEQIRLKQDNNCWGCHMPKSGTIDIPHVTVTDHRIRVPVKKAQTKSIKEFAGIYCINNVESDQHTKLRAYLSYFEKFEGESSSLDTVATFIQSNNTDDAFGLDLKIHFYYLRNDYQSIIKLASNMQANEVTDPWICYRIGQAYQNMQQAQTALPWYIAANHLAPENLDFANKLGACWIQIGKVNEGIKLLNLVLQQNPKQPEALTNIGFGYASLQDYNMAMTCYNKALQLDPDMQQALLNKAALCNLNGDKAMAKKLLNHILKDSPDNNYIKELLKTL